MLAIGSNDFLSTPLILLASVWIGVWAFTRWRKIRKKTTFKTPLSGLGPPEPMIPLATAQRSPQPRAEPATRAALPASRAAMTATDVRSLAIELQQLLADLNDTARRMAAQMDNRHTRLETLLAEADKKISRLDALNTQATGSEHHLEIDPHADLACVTTHLNSISSSIHGPCSTSKDLLHAPADPTHRKIYDLADKGKSPRDIAQQLTKHPGEVELILALRRRNG